jgi:hypothetical protein
VVELVVKRDEEGGFGGIEGSAGEPARGADQGALSRLWPS